MHNLLVISDLHLGEDLGPGASPSERVEQTQRALVAFLEHYAVSLQDEKPWKLIINGDMVDFLSVYLSPEDLGETGSEDAHEWGYGAEEMASVAKFERVRVRHEAFFEALKGFLHEGNEVHIVLGNHDANFHWASTQARFRDAVEPEKSKDKLVFHPWFFVEEGVLYVEHGHQYDGFCSFEDPLSPEDLDNPTTLEENLGIAAMRYLGNHLPVEPDATADLSLVEYLHLVINSRHDVTFRFFGGYAAVVRALGKQWLARIGQPARFLERKRRRLERMAAFANQVGMEPSVVNRIHKLRRPPVFVDLLQLIRSVMLGRLLSGVLTVLFIPMLLPFLLFFMSSQAALMTVLSMLGSVALFHLWMAQGRDNVDPSVTMRRAAGRIHRITRLPVVTFGHSHVPVVTQLERRGWYVNSGSWAGGEDRTFAFTHVKILRRTHSAEVSLCRWRGGESRILRSEIVRTIPHSASLRSHGY